MLWVILVIFIDLSFVCLEVWGVYLFWMVMLDVLCVWLYDVYGDAVWEDVWMGWFVLGGEEGLGLGVEEVA